MKTTDVEWSAITGIAIHVMLPALAGNPTLDQTFWHLLLNHGKYNGNVTNIMTVLTGEAFINALRK